MSKPSKKRRTDDVLSSLREYAESRTLDLSVFNHLHCRLTDGYSSLDIWPTTGRYFVWKTDYSALGGKGVVERSGERGILPIGAALISTFLDSLFFAADTL